jgi:hypothetical protein
VELAAPSWAAGEADSLFTRVSETTVSRKCKRSYYKDLLGGLLFVVVVVGVAAVVVVINVNNSRF